MAKETKQNPNKMGRNQWLDVVAYNPVRDIWDPNKGGSKNAQAPEATKARGASYSTKSSKKGKKS